jgi:large subunit ribosomal protein L15
VKLNELKSAEGSRQVAKRVGRGYGSGLGKNCGTGHKGQNSRSGGGVRIGFEGGQTPIYRRSPKRGFTNYTEKEYATINVGDLESLKAGSKVTLESLKEKGILKTKYTTLKVLGNGKLTKKLTVVANKFTKSAEKAIVDAGGKIEVI